METKEINKELVEKATQSLFQKANPSADEILAEQKLNEFLEENKEMVDLVLKDYQKFQKRLYEEKQNKKTKFLMRWNNETGWEKYILNLSLIGEFIPDGEEHYHIGMRVDDKEDN